MVHRGAPEPHGPQDYVLTKYLDPMVPTHTMGFRVTTVDHMCLCSHGLMSLNLNVASRSYGMAKWPLPTEKRYMWSTVVTLNPMVLVETMVLLDILMKSDYVLTKYIDPNMVPTYTMGFRVTTVDHMCLCSHGLMSLNLKLALKIYPLQYPPPQVMRAFPSSSCQHSLALLAEVI